MTIIDRIKKFIGFWYYQYILHTGLYMLEQWEMNIFNGFLVAVFAMASYTTYLYLPGHLAMLSRYLPYLTGQGDLHPHTGVDQTGIDGTGETMIGSGS